MHCNDANCAGDDESITSTGTARLPLAGFGFTSLVLDADRNPVVSYSREYILMPGWILSLELTVMHCNDPGCVGGDESFTSPDRASGRRRVRLTGPRRHRQPRRQVTTTTSTMA